MRLLKPYAMIVISFNKMYHEDRRPGRNTVAIACAMAGLLMANMLSIIFIVVPFVRDGGRIRLPEVNRAETLCSCSVSFS